MPNTAGLNVTIKAHDHVTPTVKQIQSSIIRFVGAISAALATVRGVAFPVKRAAEFERELKNVQKTTGFSEIEMRSLADTLNEMSTELLTSQTELAKIAAAAGQLGLGQQGRKAIEEFTRSVAMASATFDIAADSLSAFTAQILNVFDLPVNQVENLFSSINDVSNKSVASAEKLIDIIKRVGNVAGLTITDVNALAATTQDLGVSSEVAGTTLVKQFSNMQAKASAFADAMATTTEDWVNRVETDALGAFKQILQRLAEMDTAARAASIRELFGGGRIFSLASKQVRDAANGFAILDRNLRNSTEAYEDGTSSIREYEVIASSLSGRMENLGNTIRKLGIDMGTRLIPILKDTVQSLKEFFESDEAIALFERLGEAMANLIAVARRVATVIHGQEVVWRNLLALIKVAVIVSLAKSFLTLASATTKSATSLLGLLNVFRLFGKAPKTVPSLLGSPTAGAGSSGKKVTKESLTQAHTRITLEQIEKVEKQRVIASRALQKELVKESSIRRQQFVEARRAYLAETTATRNKLLDNRNYQRALFNNLALSEANTVEARELTAQIRVLQAEEHRLAATLQAQVAARKANVLAAQQSAKATAAAAAAATAAYRRDRRDAYVKRRGAEAGIFGSLKNFLTPTSPAGRGLIQGAAAVGRFIMGGLFSAALAAVFIHSIYSVFEKEIKGLLTRVFGFTFDVADDAARRADQRRKRREREAAQAALEVAQEAISESSVADAMAEALSEGTREGFAQGMDYAKQELDRLDKLIAGLGGSDVLDNLNIQEWTEGIEEAEEALTKLRKRLDDKQRLEIVLRGGLDKNLAARGAAGEDPFSSKVGRDYAKTLEKIEYLQERIRDTSNTINELRDRSSSSERSILAREKERVKLLEEQKRIRTQLSGEITLEAADVNAIQIRLNDDIKLATDKLKELERAQLALIDLQNKPLEKDNKKGRAARAKEIEEQTEEIQRLEAAYARLAAKQQESTRERDDAVSALRGLSASQERQNRNLSEEGRLRLENDVRGQRFTKTLRTQEAITKNLTPRVREVLGAWAKDKSALQSISNIQKSAARLTATIVGMRDNLGSTLQAFRRTAAGISRELGNLSRDANLDMELRLNVAGDFNIEQELQRRSKLVERYNKRIAREEARNDKFSASLSRTALAREVAKSEAYEESLRAAHELTRAQQALNLELSRKTTIVETLKQATEQTEALDKALTDAREATPTDTAAITAIEDQILNTRILLTNTLEDLKSVIDNSNSLQQELLRIGSTPVPLFGPSGGPTVALAEKLDLETVINTTRVQITELERILQKGITAGATQASRQDNLLQLTVETLKEIEERSKASLIIGANFQLSPKFVDELDKTLEKILAFANLQDTANFKQAAAELEALLRTTEDNLITFREATGEIATVEPAFVSPKEDVAKVIQDSLIDIQADLEVPLTLAPEIREQQLKAVRERLRKEAEASGAEAGRASSAATAKALKEGEGKASITPTPDIPAAKEAGTKTGEAAGKAVSEALERTTRETKTEVTVTPRLEDTPAVPESEPVELPITPKLEEGAALPDIDGVAIYKIKFDDGSTAYADKPPATDVEGVLNVEEIRYSSKTGSITRNGRLDVKATATIEEIIREESTSTQTSVDVTGRVTRLDVSEESTLPPVKVEGDIVDYTVSGDTSGKRIEFRGGFIELTPEEVKFKPQAPPEIRTLLKAEEVDDTDLPDKEREIRSTLKVDSVEGDPAADLSVDASVNLDGVENVGGIEDYLRENPIRAALQGDGDQLAASITRKPVIDVLLNATGLSVGGKSIPIQTKVAAASGGYIRGPGTSTSDSILARLSDKEYVIRAAAVRRYGVRFFDMLNKMRMPMPAFAKGGAVSDQVGGFSSTRKKRKTEEYYDAVVEYVQSLSRRQGRVEDSASRVKERNSRYTDRSHRVTARDEQFSDRAEAAIIRNERKLRRAQNDSHISVDNRAFTSSLRDRREASTYSVDREFLDRFSDIVSSSSRESRSSLRDKVRDSRIVDKISKLFSRGDYRARQIASDLYRSSNQSSTGESSEDITSYRANRKEINEYYRRRMQRENEVFSSVAAHASLSVKRDEIAENSAKARYARFRHREFRDVLDASRTDQNSRLGRRTRHDSDVYTRSADKAYRSTSARTASVERRGIIEALRNASFTSSVDSTRKATARSIREVLGDTAMYSTYTSLSNALQSLATTNTSINSRTLVDEELLRKLREVLASSSKYKYASGGYVTGPGTSTSDSILARLSNREYVMQAAAVDKYGVGLFDELNAMRVNIPGFAEGGPVSTSSFLPQQSSSESTVNIQLGARRATLRGEKEQVRRFVDMLNNIEAVR